MTESYDSTPNLDLTKPAHGSFEGYWEVPVNENSDKIDAVFDATSGHTHDGSIGGGGQVSHTNLTNIGSNTHDDIDEHIADTSLHVDGPKVGTVTGIDPAITVSDVTEIEFDNATVEDMGGGVVRVTTNSSTGPSYAQQLYYKPESAAISYTDNFNWEPGSVLSDHSWATVLSYSGAHDWTVGGNVIGTYAYVRSEALNGLAMQDGYGIMHCVGHVPHGSAQRVVVKVESLRPYKDSAGAISNLNGLTYIANEGIDDSVTLSLDLLSATQGFVSARPCAYGLSLLIRKQTGDTALSYVLNVRGNNTPYVPGVTLGVLWTDFTGGPVGDLNGRDYAYIEGWHELSVRRHPTIAGAYYVHYYHNEGLAWYRLFDPNSTNAAEALIAAEIDNLQSALAASTNPAQPPFGRMGVSFGYSLNNTLTSHVYELRLKHISVGSQDDEIATKLVNTPTSTTPTTTVQACPSGVFSGYDTTDYFEYQGPNTNTTLFYIADTFTTLGQNQNYSGFLVTGGSVSDIVYCESPSPSTPTPGINSAFYADTTISSSSTRGVFLDGERLVRGDKGDVTDNIICNLYVVNNNEIPRDWGTSGVFSAGYYNQGDLLPTNFIDVTYVDARYVDSSQRERIYLAYTASKHIPIGAEIRVEIEPKYESTFDATWEPITIVQPVPVVESHTTLAWDDIGFYNAANVGSGSKWVPVTPDGNGDPYVLEGMTVCFGASITNFPLGLEFWDGDGFIVPTLMSGNIYHVIVPSSDIVGINAIKVTNDVASATTAIFRNVSRPFSITDQSRISKYFDAVLPYEVGVDDELLTADATNIAPPSAVNSSLVLEHANVSFNSISTDMDSVVQIHKLSDSLGHLVVNSTTINNLLSLNMADTIYANNSALTFLPASAQKVIPILSGLQLFPRNPEVISHSIDTLEAGQPCVIELIVRYHHDVDIADDLTVEAVSGISGIAIDDSFYGGPGSTQTDPTAVTPSGYNAYRRLVVSGTLGGSGDIVVRVKKSAMYTWLQNQPQAVQDFADSVGIDGTTNSVGNITLGLIDEVSHPVVTERGTNEIAEGETTKLRFYVSGVDLSTKPEDEIITSLQVSVPSYLDLPGLAPVIYKDNDTGASFGYYGVYIIVNCGDAETVDPSLEADIEFLTAGVPAPGTIVPIPVIASIAPDITGGGLNLALTEHEWELTGQLLPKDVYFTITDVKATTSISIELTSANAAASIDYDPITPVVGTNTYQVQIRLLSSEPLTDDYLTIHASTPFLEIGAKSDSFGTGANFVQFAEQQIAGPTNYEVTTQVFNNPRVGQYVTFQLPGIFDFSGIDISDLGELNTKFVLDVVRDSDLTTVVWENMMAEPQIKLTSAVDGTTTDVLHGWVIVNPADLNGEYVAVKVTNTFTSDVTYYRPSLTAPAAVDSFLFQPALIPVIEIQSLIPVVEGAAMSTHTLTGSGLAALQPPTGEPEIFFSYSYEYSGVSDPLTHFDVTAANAGNATVEITASAATAGQTISIAFYDSVVGTRATIPVFQIVEAPPGALSIDEVLIYPATATYQYIADPTAVTANTIPYTTTNAENIKIIVKGDYLTANIKAAYITVCGDDDTDRSLPPAFGWTIADISDRSVDVSIERTYATADGIAETLVFAVPKTARWSNQRVKIFFEDKANPGTYFDPATIDSTGVAAIGSLANAGLTVKYGPPYTNRYDLNVDPGAGTTVYDISHDAQTEIGGWAIPPGGDFFTATLLFATAPEGLATSSFIMEPGTNGESLMITSLVQNGPLEWEVTFEPASGDDVVLWQTGATVGVKFANGVPIFAARLGEANWEDDPEDVEF